MTARPVPLPCGPTPDPARVANDPREAAIAAAIERREDGIEAARFRLAREKRDAQRRCDAALGAVEAAHGIELSRIDREYPAAAHGDPARTALRPADDEAHSTEETR